MDRKRATAYAKRLSHEVSDATVIDAVEHNLTFQELGERLFPEAPVNLAQKAISFAAREILSFEEMEIVRERNRITGAVRGALAHMPQGYVKNGAAERVDGKTKWSDVEEARLLELAALKAYEYPSGMHKGSPCFSMICSILNNEFHGGAHIRNGNNCFRKHKRLLEANSEGETADE